MTSVKIKCHCGICKFKVEYEMRTNEHGFFGIPDAYCPYDFSLLVQEIDGRDKEDANKRRS